MLNQWQQRRQQQEQKQEQRQRHEHKQQRKQQRQQARPMRQQRRTWTTIHGWRLLRHRGATSRYKRVPLPLLPSLLPSHAPPRRRRRW